MESEDTLRKNDDATNKILEAINSLRQETRQQIGDLRREMNERFTKIETEIEEIKQSQFSFDVRLDRVQAMAHDALNIGHDLKADVKILHAEVRAWAADVMDLQQKI
jgi:proline dehydrogenase